MEIPEQSHCTEEAGAQTTGPGAWSGLTALVSEKGLGGRVSSLGSTIDTLSGRGFLGPVLPVGSNGNMILTCQTGVSEVVVNSSKLVYFTKTKCEDLIEVNVILGIDHTQKLVALLLLTTDKPNCTCRCF